MSHIKPILNPPIDFSRIGQDQVEAAQANETAPAPEAQTVDAPIGTIESGVLDVTVSEGESTSEPAEDTATENAGAKPSRARSRR